MPTPSDGTANQPPSYEEMSSRAQAGLDEEARAVQQQRDLHNSVQQSLIPHSKSMPPTSGDCPNNEKY